MVACGRQATTDTQGDAVCSCQRVYKFGPQTNGGCLIVLTTRHHVTQILDWMAKMWCTEPTEPIGDLCHPVSVSGPCYSTKWIKLRVSDVHLTRWANQARTRKINKIRDSHVRVYMHLLFLPMRRFSSNTTRFVLPGLGFSLYCQWERATLTSNKHDCQLVFSDRIDSFFRVTIRRRTISTFSPRILFLLSENNSSCDLNAQLAIEKLLLPLIHPLMNSIRSM